MPTLADIAAEAKARTEAVWGKAKAAAPTTADTCTSDQPLGETTVTVHYTAGWRGRAADVSIDAVYIGGGDRGGLVDADAFDAGTLNRWREAIRVELESEADDAAAEQAEAYAMEVEHA